MPKFSIFIVYKSAVYPFCVREWNNLESSLRVLPSISQLKTVIIRFIRPLPPPPQKKRSIYHLSDIPGCKLLTRLCLEFSELREHKFRHNFKCTDPMCPCENGVEDNEHFLLHGQRFSIYRSSYLDNVPHLINRLTTTLSNSLLCNILLFGDNQFNDITNMLILESTVDFCKKKTGRFKCIS